MLMLYKKNLNEVIDIVNQLSEFVNTIDVNFDDIYEKIDIINNEITRLNDSFTLFENRINANVQAQLNSFNTQIIVLLNDYQTIFNENLLHLKNELEDEIHEIELGNVEAYDPTTRYL